MNTVPRLPLIVALSVAVGAVVALSVFVVARRAPTPSPPEKIDVILIPHPDDEMEAWSLIEGADSTYRVFVYLTLGEATVYCDENLPGYQPETGEWFPEPTPAGSHTLSCEEARVQGTLLFLNRMAESDRGLPGGFDASAPRVSPPFPDLGAELTRVDEGVEVTADRRVRVFDGGDRGMAMFWNMGDGDLTSSEVAWVVDTILANRAKLGIPDLPWNRAIGANFYHDGAFADCVTYDHPDHGSVRDVLMERPLASFVERLVPTCRTNPRAEVALTVQHFGDAFDLGGPAPDGHRMRSGAHNTFYGWLATPYYGGDWEGQGAQTGELFHRSQYFEVARG